MSLADPMVIAIGGSNRSLIRISTQGTNTIYKLQESLQEFVAKVRHTDIKAKGDEPAALRHNMELTWIVYATATAAQIKRRYYFVSELPLGDTDVSLAAGVCGFETANTNANLVKLVNQES